MKKVIKLTENELTALVKRVIREVNEQTSPVVPTTPFNPNKTINPGTKLIKPEQKVSKKQFVWPTPKEQSIPLIQIKVGDLLVDLTMMKKNSRGATFYGKIRNHKEGYFREHMEIPFQCGRSQVVMYPHGYYSSPIYEPDHNFPLEKISPEATKLLNKASGCDSYASNQDTSSNMV